MTVQTPPAVNGAATTSAMTAAATRPPTALAPGPRFGMTMWFKVVVGALGTDDLGLWSSCSGLGVTFGTEQVKDGGHYDGTQLLPGEIGYGNVTLERAMRQADSKRLRTWLEQVAAEWVDGGKDGRSQEGTTVTITLFSNVGRSADQEVAKWELHNVFPVSWSGPTLSSKGGDVAVEKLTFAHRGFLLTDKSSAAAPPAGNDASAQSHARQGMLKLSYDNVTLEFQYNPAKVELTKTALFKTGTTLLRAKDAHEQVTDPTKLTIKLNAILIEGQAEVKKTITQLWEWLEPLPSGGPPAGANKDKPPGDEAKEGSTEIKPPADGAKQDGTEIKLKVLQLTMGSKDGGIGRSCALKAVGVTYTRFTSTSVPSRAVVNLSLEEVLIPTKGQNPTSGGPPGRRVHVVTEGECLQHIATEAYGRPSAWREVAESNGVDDPLRVRNGQTVYLSGTRSP